MVRQLNLAKIELICYWSSLHDANYPYCLLQNCALCDFFPKLLGPASHNSLTSLRLNALLSKMNNIKREVDITVFISGIQVVGVHTVDTIFFANSVIFVSVKV